MTSRAEKMKNKLVNVAKTREEFEQKRKELEAEMHKGKSTLGEIQKGLRNRIIGTTDTDLDEESHKRVSVNRNTSKGGGSEMGTLHEESHKRVSVNRNIGKGGGSYLDEESHKRVSVSRNIGKGGGGTGSSVRSPELSPQRSANAPFGTTGTNIVMPSAPRLSDWCYTGALDSMPPVVKEQTLYETTRLLGRGSFGEVNLVKNKEDNKL